MAAEVVENQIEHRRRSLRVGDRRFEPNLFDDTSFARLDVGRAAAMICNALDLDLVVVGGTVALGFAATFYNAAQEEIDEVAKIGLGAKARITPARLGDHGPLIGAGAIGLRGVRRESR